MKNIAKTGCVALLLSLVLTASCLAQQTRKPRQAQRALEAPRTQEAPKACWYGKTADGKCLNPAIAGLAACNSRALGNAATNRDIPAVAANGGCGIYSDPIHRNARLQVLFGLNCTSGFTSCGSQRVIYGQFR